MVEPGLNPVNLDPEAILLSSTSEFHKLLPRGQVQATFIKKLFLEHTPPYPFLWVLSMTAFMLTKAELKSCNREHIAIKPEVFSIRFLRKKID